MMNRTILKSPGRRVLSAVALALAGGSAVAGPLNDTGIDFCVDHATGAQIPVTTTTTCADGQDARYGRDPAAQRGALTKVGGGSKGFDFTKIANNGSMLPANATLGSGPNDWACTYDNNTSLIWEVKTVSGLRSQSHVYSWYDSVHNYGGNPGTTGGNGCLIAGRCDTEKFVADVNAAGLCGLHGWRLPTLDELSSLTDTGIVPPGPTIDSGYFPNTPGASFWSASPVAGLASQAWVVEFSNGVHLQGQRSDVNHVRLVHTGK